MESSDLVPLTARLGANPFFTLVAMIQVRELAPTHVQRGEQDRNLQCQANLFPKVTEQGASSVAILKVSLALVGGTPLGIAFSKHPGLPKEAVDDCLGPHR